MELTEEIKDLLKGHEMAKVSDFLDTDESEFYLENTDLHFNDIERLSNKYEGWGMDSFEDSIVSKLKELANI